MKYKLLKDLPLAKIGTEVELGTQAINSDTIPMFPIKWDENKSSRRCLGMIFEKDIPEWLQEVKEPKTIYDLKKGDKYYVLDDGNEVTKYEVPSNTYLNNPYCRFNFFVTEREAKRNKLLRELATRTDKWLPIVGDNYYSYHLTGCDSWNWQGDNTDMIKYHSGLVFRNEKEYNKYITEEAKDLLFKI